jgi:hypothetical protein
MKTIIGEWSGGVTARLELSKYALIGGTTKNAPRFYQITLDSNGAISAGYEIWANDEIMPEGTTYRLTVYDSSGLIIVGPDQLTICGTAPINLNLPSVTPPTPPPTANPITITPGFVTLHPGQTQQFTANMAVTWTSSDAHITSAGLYTAPNVTATTMVTITATSLTDPMNTAQIVISIQPVAGITISISPTSVVLIPNENVQFTYTVSGTTNQNVVWHATQGTISPTGIYIAPNVSASTTATITVTSAADTTVSATAQAVIQVASGTISVTIAPSGTSLSVNQTQQFTATVTGSANQNVTWTIPTSAIPELPAGNGTIVSTGISTADYTAPSTIVLSVAITVGAVSVADPTKNAGATVVLLG